MIPNTFVARSLSSTRPKGNIVRKLRPILKYSLSPFLIIHENSDLYQTTSELFPIQCDSLVIPTLPPTLLTSVNTFHASEINNAIVVSNSYWSNLSKVLPALILTQLIASVLFFITVSFVVVQGKFLFDRLNSLENTQKPYQRRMTNLLKRPTEVNIDFVKLFLCVIIDIIGSSNEALPVVGEIVDIVYTPIAALLLRQLFEGSNIIFLLELVEEILPFTDVLPLATICWVVESFFGGGDIARLLNIGDFAPKKQKDDFTIDLQEERGKKGNDDDDAVIFRLKAENEREDVFK